MDFTVPRAYYTEWWNINTHRCNHINRPPVNQEMYGYGRSFVADWARTGAVSISHVSDKFQVTYCVLQLVNDILRIILCFLYILIKLISFIDISLTL